ncbi:MAG: hypothetical protein ACKOE6_08165, partial [Flammeovirgaceae bacterium]
PLDQLEEKQETTEVTSSTEPISSEGSEQSSENEQAEKEEVRSPYIPEEEPKSKAPVIIGIIIALVVVLAGFLIYQYVIAPNREKDRLAKIELENARKAKEEADKIARQQEEERKRREAEEAAANAKPAEGAIESLTAPTGRYYVVVASAVDADLVMDYAKKLSAKGVSTKIIPPFGKSKFSRITISDHDSFAAGQTAADAAKTEYGDAVWVIRY